MRPAHHPLRRAALVTAALALAGCTDALPCRDCPPLAGTYTIDWAPARLVAEGCPPTGPRPPTLTFTQVGSTAATTIGEVALDGTVYDTSEFSLRGADAGVTYALRGVVVAGPTASDGGSAHLTGTLTTQSDECELREDYTGDKDTSSP